MPAFPATRLIAVDIGNTLMKRGTFDGAGGVRTAASARRPKLPKPESSFECPTQGGVKLLLADLPDEPAVWYVASVHGATARNLEEAIRQRRTADSFHLMSYRDVPLDIGVERPERVGLDRLAAAVGANHVRRPNRPAIVVDIGTAITVDALDAGGAFLGGAILPGPGLAARALHEHTDQLPLIDAGPGGDAIPPIGTSTEAAMQSGLFYGALGGVRELIRHMTTALGGRPQVLLSGGYARLLAPRLGRNMRYVPHLVLAGIALCAAHPRTADGAEG